MPTATISGTTHLEDTCIFASGPDSNAGGAATQIVVQGPAVAVGLIRVAASQIPAGTLTAVRLLFRTGSSSALTLNAFAVTDANVWGEGVGNFGAANNGEATWNNARHGELAWAGAAGCSVDGTDYRTDASPPSIAVPGSGASLSWSLPTAWFTNWRDAVWVNNGMRIVHTGTPSLIVRMLPSEHATTPLYFEIDYEEAAASKPAYYQSLLRRVRR